MTTLRGSNSVVASSHLHLLTINALCLIDTFYAEQPENMLCFICISVRLTVMIDALLWLTPTEYEMDT